MEVPTEIIIAWVVCISIIVVITYKWLKDSKRNDDYFRSDDRIIDDFYTRKEP